MNKTWGPGTRLFSVGLAQYVENAVKTPESGSGTRAREGGGAWMEGYSQSLGLGLYPCPVPVLVLVLGQYPGPGLFSAPFQPQSGEAKGQTFLLKPCAQHFKDCAINRTLSQPNYSMDRVELRATARNS